MSKPKGNSSSNFSKPPAGDAKSGSSHIKPSGGVFAGGGQELPLPPLVDHICKSIKKRATEAGVSVPPEVAVAFAQDYASKQSKWKNQYFSTDDVSEAVSIFEGQYEPPESPAVGGVAGGGHATLLDNYVKAIFSAIITWRKSARHFIYDQMATEFANSYASEHPPQSKKKFKQSEVDCALQVFRERQEQWRQQREQERLQREQEQQQQREQEQRRQQPTRTPNNLFGKLLHKGKEVGILHENLIPYLKWWTMLPEICGIAEDPSPADVEYGFKEMLKAISQGVLLLQQIVKAGVLPEKVKLEIQKLGISFEFVFVFYKCPCLLVLQRALCMKNADGVSATAGFIEGFLVHSDGHMSHFKQRARDDKSDPTHMKGAMAIVFPSSIGNLRLKSKAIGVADDPFKKHEKFDPTDQYHGENPRDSWPGMGHANSTEYIIVKPGDIPSAAQQVDFSKRDKILGASEFLSYYQKTMMELGGVPIPVRQHVEHQDAAEVASAESFSELTTCKHGNCVGGQFNLRCNDCDWGM